MEGREQRQLRMQGKSAMALAARNCTLYDQPANSILITLQAS